MTIESFVAWSEQFMEELRQKREKAGMVEKRDPSRLTGKELFLRDHTLDDSDVTFLEDGGESYHASVRLNIK